jgi:hypothetical protein
MPFFLPALAAGVAGLTGYSAYDMYDTNQKLDAMAEARKPEEQKRAEALARAKIEAYRANTNAEGLEYTRPQEPTVVIRQAGPLTEAGNMRDKPTHGDFLKDMGSYMITPQQDQTRQHINNTRAFMGKPDIDWESRDAEKAAMEAQAIAAQRERVRQRIWGD